MRILILSIHEETGDTVNPNAGIYRLQHYLEKNGIACDLCEVGLEDDAAVLRNTADGMYDIIGVSHTYAFLEKELPRLIPFREAASGTGCLWITGGLAPSRLPELWLEIGFDVVVLGFGEFPLLALAQKGAQASGDWAQVDFGSIDGIAWRDASGKNQLSPARPLSEEDFRLLNYSLPKEMGIPDQWMKFISHAGLKPEEANRNTRFHTVPVFTSQKCPNRCGYCSSVDFLKNIYGRDCAVRSLNTDDICDLLISYYQRYGTRFYFFTDDDLPTPKRFALELCEKINEHKRAGRLPEDLCLYCQSRVLDFINLRTGLPDHQLFKAMSSAGFKRANFGIETFSKRLLNTAMMNKKHYDYDIAWNLLTTAQTYGLEALANFMIMVPEATKEEIAFTIRCLLDLQDINGIAVMGMFIVPYPGAAAFDDPRYPTHNETFTSPLNGALYIKKQYFLPHDPEIHDALLYYMHEGVRVEIDKIKDMYGQDINIRDGRLLNMIKCYVVAKKLKLDDLVPRLESGIHNRALKISA